jgi:trans-aconitate 2-methyltransferase
MGDRPGNPDRKLDQMDARSWDAPSYDRVSGPMTAMAAAVLNRLELRGDELVLDAGCGTGRVSELLLERLPDGKVLAVDADAQMVGVARQNLGDRAEVQRVDLLELSLEVPVDAIFSTATFHWVLDHPLLFERLFYALRPGGQLVAQCGGQGNIVSLKSAAASVGEHEPFASFFDGWVPPWYYAGPKETRDQLEAAGFQQVETWLEPWPVIPNDPTEYLETVPLGPHCQRLPHALRNDFIQAVVERLPQPVTVDYVRLNINARRPQRA